MKTNLITPEKPVLVLRVCKPDMRSHGGFTWPESGLVECTDWEDNTKYGNGLHGWLWGEGDHSAADIREDSKWLVVQVGAYVDLGGKVKYPKGEVLYCGDCLSATTFLAANGGHGRAIIGGTSTAGDQGRATAGYKGHATAGVQGIATAGYKGHATAGDWGIATAGDQGIATAGYKGRATAGYKGHAIAGDQGHATAGDWGHATAGVQGIATAGYKGHAIAGHWGIATAGHQGRATAGYKGHATAGVQGIATAGDQGTLIIERWDGKRWRVAIAYVGEQGIEANKPYRLDNAGNFIPA